MSSRWLKSLLLVLPLLAVACGDDSDGSRPQAGSPPTVREITPTGGPIAGNTLINVYGSGFKEGAKLYLGDQETLRTVVVNSFRIYGYTPTGTSAQVDVRVVNPDGAYGVLVRGFTYEGPPSAEIAQAEVISGNIERVSNGQPVGADVEAAITVAGRTRGAGQGPGVRAQVGFAPGTADVLNPNSYTWEEAGYMRDSDSGEADIYKGNVQLQPPIGGENREWVVTMRFSIDGGTTWVMADGDGIANGLSGSLMRRVFISRPRVDYCKLGPDSNRASLNIFYRPDASTLTEVVGQVFAAGITQGNGAGSGLTAQVGYGPVDSDPRTSNAWTWINATYKGDIGNNDEFAANLPNPGTLGRYRVAIRFSISENTWRVCDVNGVNDSTEGDLTFDPNRLGILTVGTEEPKPAVDWCKLGENDKAPEEINYQTTTQAAGLKTVFAQVFMTGVTPAAGAGAGLVAQLGYGPAGSDPREESSGWTWTAMTFNRDQFSANDEWKGTLPNPVTLGNYSYAVRFSANGGPVRVCDGNGHNDEPANPFELEQLGKLSVTGEPVVQRVVGYCKLGPDGNPNPETVNYLATATANRTVVGQVFVQGVTQGTGAGSGIIGQLGWGPANENPTTSGQWNWTTSATYRGEVGNNDEFQATLPNPAVVGSYRFAYRFQVNGGAFLYCDADGNSGTPTGFDVTKLSTLNVTDEPVVQRVVGYCKLGPDGNSTPETVSYVTTATANRTVVGQVYVQDVTQGTGAGSGVVGQLGWGPAGENPTTSGQWNWTTSATYRGEIGNNDEFQATLPNPGVVGSYRFAYRFQVNGGAFLYCDADGGSNATEFDPTKLGTLNVTQDPVLPRVVGYCKLGPDGNSTPETVSYVTTATANRTVVGQVYVQDVTQGTGAGSGVVGQLGWGPAGEDPTTSGQWNWTTSATYRGEIGNNDEFQATLPNPGVVGSYRFAYRFQVNGGAFLYCDADGNSGAAFDVALMGTLNVTEPVVPRVVGYCKLGPDGNTTPESVTYGLRATANRVVVGQVFVQDVTAGAGAGTGIVAQLGVGPEGVDPATSGQWSWTTSATYKGEIGNNEEFEATLPNPGVVGTYRFAYRFQVNGGAFLYCDADGNSGGASEFDPARMGTLTVFDDVVVPRVVGYCKLGPDSNNTPESVTYVANAPANRVVVSQVYVQDVTPAPGAGAGIVGQLGWGPAGEDPATSSQWNWTTSATFRRDLFGANDEFEATLPNPGVAGSYRFAYRFQVNGGDFLLCDSDGNEGGDFDPALLGTLTVEAPPPAVCRLQSVSGTTVGSGDAVTVTGRVRIPGVTDGDGPGANIQVQVGVGSASEDASTNPAAFTWKTAAYSREAPDEAATDEHDTTVHPAYEGNRAVSMRYSTDGAAWTYCDKDGSDVGGYTAGQQHAFTVNKHTDIDYCNLQWPFSMPAEGGDRTVYGQVYEEGVTNQGGAGAGITAELGYGSTAMDPGVSGWTWVAAPFLSDEGSNDQFSLVLPARPAGTTYTYRYRLNNGPYCYGDRNDRGGNGRFGDGLSGDNLGTVVP